MAMLGTLTNAPLDLPVILNRSSLIWGAENKSAHPIATIIKPDQVNLSKVIESSIVGFNC
ncbi:hypothetical protein CU048_01720 [Beijerinckiaceae bacterium]|nr:hypothetical protein CU048_01720 [Beijerinckiaceae bacterium]